MRRSIIGCTLVVIGVMWVLIPPYAIWLSHTSAQPIDLMPLVVLNGIIGLAVTILGGSRLVTKVYLH